MSEICLEWLCELVERTFNAVCVYMCAFVCHTKYSNVESK